MPGLNTVILPSGTYPLTLPEPAGGGIAGGDLDVTDTLRIRGSGSTSRISAADNFRVLDIAAVFVRLDSLSIRHGSDGQEGAIQPPRGGAAARVLVERPTGDRTRRLRHRRVRSRRLTGISRPARSRPGNAVLRLIPSAWYTRTIGCPVTVWTPYQLGSRRLARPTDEPSPILFVTPCAGPALGPADWP